MNIDPMRWTHKYARTAVRWITREIGALRRATSGSFSVEMALAMTALLVLAVGSYDFGRFAMAKARLSSAAHAGAIYGIQDLSTSTDAAGIAQAARLDAGDSALSVGSRLVCSCANGGEVPCGGTCDDGLSAPVYVEVTVQDTIGLMFSYPGVPQTINLSTTNQLRYR
jgi:Flp pilus assembly protein TadG